MSKPVAVDDHGMSMNWLSRLGRRLAPLFSWQAPDAWVDYLDRDAERMTQELELILIRFPDHA